MLLPLQYGNIDKPRLYLPENFYADTILVVKIAMRSSDLKQILSEEIQTAITQQQEDRLRALRSVHELVVRAERKKKAALNRVTLTIDETAKLLLKAIKTRKAAIEKYKEQRRDILVKIETEELAIVDQYLPKQLTAEEIREVVDQVIAQVAADGSKDMLTVLGLAREVIGPGARRKVIVKIIEEQLNKTS